MWGTRPDRKHLNVRLVTSAVYQLKHCSYQADIMPVRYLALAASWLFCRHSRPVLTAVKSYVQKGITQCSEIN
jgi:hypothetical protein